jgi:hypothetical protein
LSAYVIQFPHPGGEHVPKLNDMPWNVAPHKRKFMVAPGEYRDSGGESGSGEIAFWGEWEGPSRVIRRWERRPRFPTVLHRPFMGDPPSEGFRQNTDPWVFGDRFHYSNCKQLTNRGRTITAMQRITPGSLILFGSSVNNEFVLDTAFVVGRVQGTYTVREHDHLQVSEEFRMATIESMASPDEAQIDLQLTLYDGATPDEPFEGMFSFTPCVSYEGEASRFPRPTIELPGLINPKSRQSVNGVSRPLPTKEVRSAWDRVVQQVESQDLLLGTRLQLTREDQDAAHV